MDAREYLERMGAKRERRSVEALARLHEQHLIAVPFENIDIARRIPIHLQEPRILEKIVRRGRGGFCYELNGAFAWLLRELGYEVTLLSAEVAREDGGFGIPFDHMLLEVDVSGERFLADVGFGESFRRPLHFVPGPIHEEADLRYRLRAPDPDGAWLLERAPAGSSAFAPQYRFTRASRRLRDYEPACLYHQTSPESTFTRKCVVTRATPDGRVTLLKDRLILRGDGEKSESAVEGELDWIRLLRRHFGIALEREASGCERS